MEKQSLYSIVEQHEQELKDIALQIWKHPQAPYHETFASKLQKDYLAAHGFTIKEVPGMDTAFIAEYGSGRPILGITGEYDALPGLNQKVSAVREPDTGDPYGHGCGHNLLGTAGVGAALALKSLLDEEKITATIRYYGCPAEEELSGKPMMASKGVFDDLDACISWHPADMNTIWGCSFLAMNSMKFHFKGIPAHAAAAPQAGRSALDAVELMNVGANYLREHVTEKARIHYAITNGGGAPNVVPEDAEVWYYVRAPKRKDVQEITARLRKVAEGAAMMTETKVDYTLIAGCYDVLANDELGQLMLANMKEVGAPKWTEEDYKFAQEIYDLTTKDQKRKVMETYFAPEWALDKVLFDDAIDVHDRDKIMAGSTDVGDVSYITPFAQVTAATWVMGTASHTWQACAASGSGIGLNAMIFVSKTLAGTIYDVLKDPSILERAKEEHKKSLNGFKYVSPFDE